MSNPKPPVRPGEVLRYREVICSQCGNPFRCLWVPGKPPKRVCPRCKGGR